MVTATASKRIFNQFSHTSFCCSRYIHKEVSADCFVQQAMKKSCCRNQIAGLKNETQWQRRISLSAGGKDAWLDCTDWVTLHYTAGADVLIPKLINAIESKFWLHLGVDEATLLRFRACLKGSDTVIGPCWVPAGRPNSSKDNMALSTQISRALPPAHPLIFNRH